MVYFFYEVRCSPWVESLNDGSTHRVTVESLGVNVESNWTHVPHGYKDEPEMIKDISQSTYVTLFTAETSPETLGVVIQDMIVGSSMVGIDDELKQLLADGE